MTLPSINSRFFSLLAITSFVAGAPLLSAPSARAQQVEAHSPEAHTPEAQPLEAPRPFAATVSASIPLPPPSPRIFAITPERRALLNTIRFAEGTWAGGEDVGYRIMFGGGLMPSLDRHPDRVVRTARYASAAAGAYQFMPFTWDLVTRSLGVAQFGPHVQDQGALFLIQRRGALALADQGLFTPLLAAKLAPEWASFPTLAGRSYYGQPVKRYHDLRRFYEDNLSQLRGQLSADQASANLASAKPACMPADSLRCKLEALKGLGPRASGNSI
ncbi:glycoside hydrolase family 104 protein [Cyanobium sp. BA20m-14]|uniref:glycoside hydrolase family 24 protein n=1 Tax=Cyanobium sp. BA20m-14 TaxID=2823703 RepID=UPI0020CF8289|nr:glycoside hydrolase family 104 protein [Cyanobium sp. BA20m-14]